ncbi:MAG: DUF1674 domain-containing protein [Rhodospirillales bacterium]|nr:DUF1674 domain-containing protein [Alphaproteobacteria bacterium]USO04398.1 MAG: DUF1674 domain-containing protein [Rhodospirillales bacterium]
MTDKKPRKKSSGKRIPEQKQGKTGQEPPKEIGGPVGPEPTRYGDWEVGGRCSDF